MRIPSQKSQNIIINNKKMYRGELYRSYQIFSKKIKLRGYTEQGIIYRSF